MIKKVNSIKMNESFKDHQEYNNLNILEPNSNPFNINFYYEKNAKNDEDNDNNFEGVYQSTKDNNEGFDISNKNEIDEYGLNINFADLSAILNSPEQDYHCPEELFFEQNSNIQQLENTFDDSSSVNTNLILNSVEISPETITESKPVIELIARPKQNKIEDRKDYLIKKVKSSVGKYLIKLLNSKSKLHFYTPNSLEFNSQVNLRKNKEWLNWTIRDILVTYDKPNNKNNKSLIERIDLCPDKYEDILSILSKSYETILKEYFETKQCIQDASKYDKKTKQKYLGFCEVKQGAFIDYIKNTKANNKKSKRQRQKDSEMHNL